MAAMLNMLLYSFSVQDCSCFSTDILMHGILPFELVQSLNHFLPAYFLQSKFDSLDPELLNSQVSKYAKFVNQLEKGLPPNNVVPQLKDKVERMKEKVNVIS